MTPNPTATELLRECVDVLKRMRYAMSYLKSISDPTQNHTTQFADDGDKVIDPMIEKATAFLAEAEKPESSFGFHDGKVKK